MMDKKKGLNLIFTKGQIISECPYEKIVSPKIPTKISEISALTSKERSNQKLN